MSAARTKNAYRQRQGAVAVEFAIALSILLMLVFASIEFVRLHMLKHSIEQASYEAARKGIIVGAKVRDVQEAAEHHLSILNVSNAVVNVSPGTISDETQVVEVNIEVPIENNSWVSPVYFSGNLKGRTRMLAERAAAEMSNAIP